jgi:rubrerythrin
MKKRYWRCFVCNDIHYGVAPPELCPTCKVPEDPGRRSRHDLRA